MRSQSQPLAPLDAQQRYTLEEATEYLRVSRAHLYHKIRDGELVVVKDGRRAFVPGSEILRLSRVPK